jgi:hypothetical protein
MTEASRFVRLINMDSICVPKVMYKESKGG